MIDEWLVALGRGGHMVAGLALLILAVWQVQARGGRGMTRARLALAGALFATSAWSVLAGWFGWTSPVAMLAEGVRNLGWTLFLFVLLDQAAGIARPRGVRAIYYALFAIAGVTLAIDGVLSWLVLSTPDPSAPGFAILTSFAFGSFVLRMIFAVGALLLVHNLYGVAAPDVRPAIALPLGVIAALWTWDLNLYTIAYLSGEVPLPLAALRGPALCAALPFLVIGFGRTRHWKLRLSRSAAFQSASLSAVALYLVAMIVVAGLLDRLGGDFVRLAQIALIFGLTLGALLLLPSGRFRAWLKVKLAKHFFQHRYDYRVEWNRFTVTLGQPGTDAPSLSARIVQAIGDIVESPSGMLLVPDEGGRMHVEARWNWRDDLIRDGASVMGESAARFFETSGHIVELDAVRADRDPRCDPGAIPAWLWDEPRAWAVVPLLHFGRLRGLVVLARPRAPRSLDWEDFDLLRIAGRQAASYLAEASGQAALIEARQFDEFNRRFAFIMHDIKNLVSQLSLVARNAERHADNPDFRADMVATLSSSVDKMNAMLARLSQHHRARPEEPSAQSLAPLVARTVAAYQAAHPVELDGDPQLAARVDPARLDIVLRHLIQNAIDASEAGAPVTVRLRGRGHETGIDVIDRGCGMDNQFIHTRLFKPFSSSKADGFGIGAYEARTLVQAMGGRIAVESTVGEGSRFTVWLPAAAAADAPAEPEPEVAAA